MANANAYPDSASTQYIPPTVAQPYYDPPITHPMHISHQDPNPSQISLHAPGAPVVHTAEAGMLGTTGTANATENSFDRRGKYRIQKQGPYAAVEVSISEFDGLLAQGGAMVTMHPGVDLKATTFGGIGSSLLRCCCAGETFFFTEFMLSPEAPKGMALDVLLAPNCPGELILLELDGSVTWRIQKGSFLACDSTIKIDTVAQDFSQGCCSGEGFFIMQASGMGRLVLNSFGSILRYDLGPGEQRVVDTGALVAWTSHTQYKISRANPRSTMSSFLSGEGFVNKFTGPGTIFAQTRSLQAFAKALQPYMPGGTGGGGDSSN